MPGSRLLAGATYNTRGQIGRAQISRVFDKGSIVVAASADDLKGAFKRVKKIDGYRWVAINRADLFGANPLSLGSKAGIIDAHGEILKNADIPRRKV